MKHWEKIVFFLFITISHLLLFHLLKLCLLATRTLSIETLLSVYYSVLINPFPVKEKKKSVACSQS